MHKTFSYLGVTSSPPPPSLPSNRVVKVCPTTPDPVPYRQRLPPLNRYAALPNNSSIVQCPYLLQVKDKHIDVMNSLHHLIPLCLSIPTCGVNNLHMALSGISTVYCCSKSTYSISNWNTSKFSPSLTDGRKQVFDT